MKELSGQSRYTLAIGLILFISVASACKKFVTVPLPGTEVDPSDIYSNDRTATAAILGIYGEMIGKNGFASGSTRSVTFLGALSADELKSYSTVQTIHEFYNNAISTGNNAIENALWGEAYKYIYAANALINGVLPPSKVTEYTRNQLTGEALFTRAFCYFYLVNLFGDVPYVLKTDYRVNRSLPRESRNVVCQGIIQDLKDAQQLLAPGYISSYNNERIRPNKWAATALLARVLLYTGDWAGAEAQSSSIIALNSSYALEDSLNKVFQVDSREAIWMLKPNTSGINTWEGKNFILTSAPASGESSSTCLSEHLLGAFEKGDLRGTLWVESITTADSSIYHYPKKYRIKNTSNFSEYSMVLRLAEQYLIRAEARVQRGNISSAAEDLNMIRRRAGLPDYSGATDKASLLAAILHEKQVELFTEWGHRWLDLKRRQQAVKILGDAKATHWQDFDTLYPIPQNERLLNQSLTQNPGYY